jgi:hypothetical protein
MADNPLLAATKAAQASRASSKEQTDKPTVPSQDEPAKAKKTAAKKTTKKPKEPEKMTTIKIPQSLARDLADKAQQVRNNNTEPVAPNERVYPAHLVQATLEHLLELPIDWASIQSVEDFRQALSEKSQP